MKIKITLVRYSENDWEGYSSHVEDEKILPVKTGIVEEYPIFKITEINDNSIKVVYNDGCHASIGTFSSVGEAEWENDYAQEKEIGINEMATASRSTQYSESMHGESLSLQLIED